MRIISGFAPRIFALVVVQSWLAALPPTFAQERKSAAAANELVGRYQLVSGEKDGQPIPAERIKGSTMRIATNAMTTFDKDEREVYVVTYELDTSTKPSKITMTAKVAPGKAEESNASGLIEKSGDTVKLVYALPGGKTPTQFKTGDKQQMFVLKKIAD